MNVLWIIPFTTHKNTPAAGSQLVYNYYQYLQNNTSFDISYIGLTYSDPDFYLMQDSFRLAVDFSFSKRRTLIDKGFDFVCYKLVIPVFKYINLSLFITNYVLKSNLRKSLDKCKSVGYKPDTIIFEFSHSGVLVDIVKEYFPESKCILTAHDLFYVNISRKFNNTLVSKFYSSQFQKYEFSKFRKFDTIITYNYKDLEILEKFNFPVSFLSPFYNLWHTNEDVIKDGILFWGALYREENYLSIFWFLDNVWDSILIKNPSLKFYIVGGGLSSKNAIKIKKYNNVVLTGYVLEPSLYFKKSFCMVVPLFKGAGIKIKVLESFASSVPVISTSVGIEGIPVNDLKHCSVCDNASDFVCAISNFVSNENLRQNIVNEAHDLLSSKFNIDESYRIFKQLIQ
ncbi:glycosyltransferase [Aquirufa sp. LEPPI-3A]|uniref:glycosyltransferase n=1 Tax=Aquirufa regiilacus TaxID=3024868 RepID=UPI0028DFB8DA|nr:glycosyltransferase [Aquirufa sp. LEPPI-3A]MDT8887878.1 glycosyltransferase [Aquirufa sp. LEPPI-3A]